MITFSALAKDTIRAPSALACQSDMSQRSSPTSNIHTKEVPSVESKHQTIEEERLPNGQGSEQKPGRKRKRSTGLESAQSQDESGEKRARTRSADCTGKAKEAASVTDEQHGLHIAHWTREGHWPEEFFRPDPIMSQQSSRKRSSSTMSYAQSVRAGENPPAYTPDYENVLAKAGIFMHRPLDQATISDDSKKTCATLLDAESTTPEHSLFQEKFFWTTLEMVRSRNEARVFRDITPSIVPSPEQLHTRGAPKVQHLTEEISAEWTKCICIAGPRPKPDLAVGFRSSAFAEDELDKLKFYTAPEKPTVFTANLYFPFLLCEVKCGENGLNIADRQSAHSASIAVDAIVQLYRSVSRATELHRKILAFSISHDHTMVRIYGHYALIKDDKATFFRHPIRELSIRDRDGRERWSTYKFVRGVYNVFAPTLLKDIRSVLAQLPKAQTAPVAPTTSTESESEGPDSQERSTSAHSSQDPATFKKPLLPAHVKLQQENDQLRQQMDLLLKQQQQQAKQLEQQSAQLVLLIQQLSSTGRAAQG